MKVKKIPMRTCVVTHEKLEKRSLLRIVRTPEGEVLPDLSGKLNGRGAYIKSDLETLEKAIKSKALEKHLEVTISNEAYEKIKEAIISNK